MKSIKMLIWKLVISYRIKRMKHSITIFKRRHIDNNKKVW